MIGNAGKFPAKNHMNLMMTKRARRSVRMQYCQNARDDADENQKPSVQDDGSE